MKTSLAIILLILCVQNTNAQLDLKGNPLRSKYVQQFTDPISEAMWMKVNMRVWSYERINHHNGRYCASLDFYSKTDAIDTHFEMRFKLNTNINEWPINNTAYIIVNEKISEIELSDINSQFYKIDDETSTTDSNGITTSVVSTRDFQLFRKQSNLTKSLSDVKFINTLSLVVYSGEIPIEFRFDEKDMDKLQAILE